MGVECQTAAVSPPRAEQGDPQEQVLPGLAGGLQAATGPSGAGRVFLGREPEGQLLIMQARFFREMG